MIEADLDSMSDTIISDYLHSLEFEEHLAHVIQEFNKTAEAKAMIESRYLAQVADVTEYWESKLDMEIAAIDEKGNTALDKLESFLERLNEQARSQDQGRYPIFKMFEEDAAFNYETPAPAVLQQTDGGWWSEGPGWASTLPMDFFRTLYGGSQYYYNVVNYQDEFYFDVPGYTLSPFQFEYDNYDFYNDGPIVTGKINLHEHQQNDHFINIKTDHAPVYGAPNPNIKMQMEEAPVYGAPNPNIKMQMEEAPVYGAPNPNIKIQMDAAPVDGAKMNDPLPPMEPMNSPIDSPANSPANSPKAPPPVLDIPKKPSREQNLANLGGLGAGADSEKSLLEEVKNGLLHQDKTSQVKDPIVNIDLLMFVNKAPTKVEEDAEDKEEVPPKEMRPWDERTTLWVSASTATPQPPWQHFNRG